MSLRILCVVSLLVALSSAASFDPPQDKKSVDLGPSQTGIGAQARAKVNCYFYSKFMVKEVDLGEKGADRLAIIPIEPGLIPECTRAQSTNEMVINQDEWSGYFKGVKGNFVFFDADDGWNGGMGFAVYDSRTGKKIFEDAAKGALTFPDVPSSRISFSYRRVLQSECIVPKDAETCWAKIQKTTGLKNAAMPDCKKSYEQSAQDMAKNRCQAQSSDNPECVAKEIQLARDQANAVASVIAYPVEVTLSPKPIIKVKPGEVGCWPSD